MYWYRVGDCAWFFFNICNLAEVCTFSASMKWELKLPGAPYPENTFRIQLSYFQLLETVDKRLTRINNAGMVFYHTVPWNLQFDT